MESINEEFADDANTQDNAEISATKKTTTKKEVKPKKATKAKKEAVAKKEVKPKKATKAKKEAVAKKEVKPKKATKAKKEAVAEKEVKPKKVTKAKKEAVAEKEVKPKKVTKAKKEAVAEKEEKPKKATKAKKDEVAELEEMLKKAKKAKKEALAEKEEESEKATKAKTVKAVEVEEISTQEIDTETEEEPKKEEKPKTTFKDLGLDDALLDALEQKGYVVPSPIQEQVIPLLLKGGVDVIGQAQTGTGKTAAFGLPILQNLEEGYGRTQALILTPTRELAIQVANEIKSFRGRKKLNVVVVYGGQPIMQQIRDLNKGADIVVGTPGRVIDLMKRGKLRTGEVEYFVLDEADEMLNMGFIDDIEWIMEECNEDRQMLLFSATMPNKIKKLAHKYMPDYKLIAVKSKEVTTKNTEQIYYPVFPKDRFKVLERILLMEPNFYGIIFSNTKLTADDITRKLLKDGIKAEALHGDIAQNQRERILKRFKDKQCTVLVATDVAARGIDVNDLTHVINYGLPQDSEAYVHRIGRTGRAGKKGTAISLVTNQDHKQLIVIEGIAKTKIRRAELPSADVLVEQRKDGIVAEVLETEVHARDRHFQDIAEKLLAEDNIEEVMVKLVKNAYGKQLNISKFNPIKQPKTLDASNSDEMRLFVAYGKNEGFNNSKIEEYFIEKVGVDDDVFLDVYVLNEFSFITVPTEVGLIILNTFKKIKKNGREIVTKAKAKGGGGGSRNSRGGFGGGNRGGGRDRDRRSSGGGRDRDRRSFGGGRDRDRRSSGGGERRSEGGGERRSYGGERRSEGGGERRSEGGGERRSSRRSSESNSGGSSFGGFSNNYGPKKSRTFKSKKRRD